LEARLERIGTERRLSRREAGEWLRAAEGNQLEMARRFFRSDPEEASNHDLVLDLGTLGSAAARAVVRHALEAKLGPGIR
jgi:cytidylate kinase